MKHVLLITILLILPLIGCTPSSEGRNLEALATPSLTAAPVTAAPITPTFVVAIEPPMPTTTVTNTTPPLQSLTATATEMPTNTPTPVLLATTAIEQRCSVSEPVQVEQTDLAQGLVFIKLQENDRSIAVLGNESLYNPIWFQPYPDSDTSSIISPNGSWIAFMTYNAVDREKDIYSMAMRVTNWNGDQEFRDLLENLTLSRFAYNKWINDSQIIFPLAHEDKLFRWLVWSPFSGTEGTLSVELPDVSQRQRLLDYAYPTPDPLLELVIYPCEACNDVEYIVKYLQTGETAWVIDLDPSLPYDYRSYAYWSPDGEFVTVIGGEFLNQLLFFNREGEKQYEITLPLLDEPGGIMVPNRAWSPDSKYLAFLYVTGSAGQYEDTLAYVDMQNGQVIDLCINARTGTPIWSPDSSKIAFSQQIQSLEDPRLISIVDIASGDVTQLYDGDGNSLVDWITIPDD